MKHLTFLEVVTKRKRKLVHETLVSHCNSSHMSLKTMYCICFCLIKIKIQKKYKASRKETTSFTELVPCLGRKFVRLHLMLLSSSGPAQASRGGTFFRPPGRYFGGEGARRLLPNWPLQHQKQNKNQLWLHGKYNGNSEHLRMPRYRISGGA